MAACQTAALFDVSDRTTIELQGAERAAFLHNFCTNDIKRLAAGFGCEAFLTNVKGRILGHIIVSATEDALWLDSEPGAGPFITSHLNRYLITEDVEVVDRSAEFAPLLLVGPKGALRLAEHIADFRPPPLWGQIRGAFSGVDVIVRRVAFTAPPGFEIIARAASIAVIRQALVDGGVPAAGSEVLDVLRLEAGFPRYGVDITEDNIAQEAGRTAQAINFTKGCYLGQEPIARLDALGHTNRELRRLQLDAGFCPAPRTAVTTPGGEPVGHITSAATNPVSGRGAALAMLRRSALADGTALLVGDTPAIVAGSSSHSAE